MCLLEVAGDAAELPLDGTAVVEIRLSDATAAHPLVEHAVETVIGTGTVTVTVTARETESKTGDAVGHPEAEAAPATASGTAHGTGTVTGTRTEIAPLDEIGTAVQAGAVRSGSLLKSK